MPLVISSRTRDFATSYVLLTARCLSLDHNFLKSSYQLDWLVASQTYRYETELLTFPCKSVHRMDGESILQLLSSKILVSLTLLSSLENQINSTLTVFPDSNRFLTPPLLPPWSESPSDLLQWSSGWLHPCLLHGLSSTENWTDAVKCNPVCLSSTQHPLPHWLALYFTGAWLSLHDLTPANSLTFIPKRFLRVCFMPITWLAILWASQACAWFIAWNTCPRCPHANYLTLFTICLLNRIPFHHF